MDRKKKSHYNSRVSLHEAPTKKQLIEKEPIQRLEKFGARAKKITGTQPCRSCNNPNWSPSYKCPPSESNCNDCGKRGHYARACRQRQNTNRTVKKFTAEIMDEPNESLSESDESVLHIEERTSKKNRNIIQRKKTGYKTNL